MLLLGQGVEVLAELGSGRVRHENPKLFAKLMGCSRAEAIEEAKRDKHANAATDCHVICGFGPLIEALVI